MRNRLPFAVVSFTFFTIIAIVNLIVTSIILIVTSIKLIINYVTSMTIRWGVTRWLLEKMAPSTGEGNTHGAQVELILMMI